ncbi:MAG: hypothetical protein GY744_03225 [Gammaproteobacteria bacterium]|nr:hypothetical protein [Gammaproteobacteria bacterium]
MRNQLILALLITLFVSGCGFHLRGDSQIAARLNPLYVVEDQLDSTQLTLIRKQLIRSGAELAQTEIRSNRLLIKLTSLKDSQITRSSLTDVEIVRLSMSLMYSVMSDSGELLIDQQELVDSVEVELDTANVLSHEQVKNRARKGLQSRLIQSMISQLGR